MFGEDVDGAVHVLRGISGPLHRDALGPARHAIADDLDEQDIAGSLRAEGGAEGTHQGHVDPVQANEVNGRHNSSFGDST